MKVHEPLTIAGGLSLAKRGLELIWLAIDANPDCECGAAVDNE